MDKYWQSAGFLTFAPSHPLSTLLHPALCPERLTLGFQLNLANGNTRSKSEKRKGGESDQGSYCPIFFPVGSWQIPEVSKRAQVLLVALSTGPSLSVDSENCAFPSLFQFSQRVASSLVIALHPAHSFVNCPFIKLSCLDDYIWMSQRFLLGP